MIDCCSDVKTLLDNTDLPIQVRYHYELLEIVNHKTECPERNNKICAIAEHNLKVCEESFGPKCIYLVKPLNSLFISYVQSDKFD